MGKNIDNNLVELPKSQLDALIASSTLTVGQCYKITDRGDRGITLTAISDYKLSLEGVRNMLCPKSYIVGSLDGNEWKGVWHITKTVVASDLMIWGGLVWRNLTGVIGTALSDIALDVTNWVVIPKSSFTNNEYVEITFSIHYDYENDWIVKQWDKNFNEFGISKEGYDQYISTLGKNPVDISDWNYTQDNTTSNILARNKCIGIYNNVENIKIHYNTCSGSIFGNSFTVASKSISGNIIGGFGNISNNRTSNSIDANSCNNISSNTNAGSINLNIIAGNIDSNSNNGYIRQNRSETISGNSNNGRIAWNLCRGGIQNNTNVGTIETNACQNIISNANNGSILTNTNGGDINSNTIDVTTISFNHNLGAISSNSNIGEISYNLNTGAVSSNSGTGSITNAWSGKDIVSRVLATPIDYFPYKKHIALITQVTTGDPTAVILDDTTGIVSGDYGRTSSGVYTITKTGLFTAQKTFCYLNPISTGTFATRASANQVSILTSADDILLDTELEIRIYQ